MIIWTSAEADTAPRRRFWFIIDRKRSPVCV